MVESHFSEMNIDGSQGEGGGAILRVGAGIACRNVGSHVPITFSKIRHNRKCPGLRPQHLLGIKALRDLTHGNVSEMEVGTTELKFTPGEKWSQFTQITIPTAGNIGLLNQTLHNGLMFAPKAENGYHILFRGGGTYGQFAPGIVYIREVTFRLLAFCGYSNKIEVKDHGFYPKGGAEVESWFFPNPEHYRGLIFQERGDLKRIHGEIHSHRQLEEASVIKRIKNSTFSEFDKIGIDRDIISLSEHYHDTRSVGVGVDIWSEFDSGVILSGGTVLGERGISSEAVGKKVAKNMISVLKSTCTIDEYASDQILPFLHFVDKPSEFILSTISSHFQTNWDLLDQFYHRERRIEKIQGGYRILLF